MMMIMTNLRYDICQTINLDDDLRRWSRKCIVELIIAPVCWVCVCSTLRASIVIVSPNKLVNWLFLFIVPFCFVLFCLCSFVPFNQTETQKVKLPIARERIWVHVAPTIEVWNTIESDKPNKRHFESSSSSSLKSWSNQEGERCQTRVDCSSFVHCLATINDRSRTICLIILVINLISNFSIH